MQSGVLCARQAFYLFLSAVLIFISCFVNISLPFFFAVLIVLLFALINHLNNHVLSITKIELIILSAE